MAETPYIQLRLGEQTLAQLDALAASAGNRSQAAREAAAYFRQAVLEAGQRNADELSEYDWERLAHLNQPDDMLPHDSRDESERAGVVDWSRRLAVELVGMWEGRAIVLPLHKQEAAACHKLAKRIGGWGLVRGYALFACLRAFWARPDTLPRWWEPECWMTPKERGS